MKNLMGKSRKVDDPYMTFDGGPFGETRVLKAWQADHTKPYARWFVYVNGDLGDTYVADILRYQRLTYVDPTLFESADDPQAARAAFMHELNEARRHLPSNAF